MNLVEATTKDLVDELAKRSQSLIVAYYCNDGQHTKTLRTGPIPMRLGLMRVLEDDIENDYESCEEVPT